MILVEGSADPGAKCPVACFYKSSFIGIQPFPLILPMAAFILQWWAEMSTDCKAKNNLLSELLQKSFLNLVSCIYVHTYTYIHTHI